MRKTVFLFFGILILIFWTRIVGMNWDQGQHLNPDERFLTMVVPALSWPHSVGQYFDTKTSPVNPHNKGFDFFVYGTWPILFVKFLGELFGMTGYDKILVVGRTVSAFFDVFSAVILFFLTLRLTKSSIASLFAMAIYGMMVLPIQQAHFFTVDSTQSFFLLLTLFLVTFPLSFPSGALVSMAFALATAAKVSSLPILGIIILAMGLHVVKRKKYDQLFYFILSFLFISYCTFRIFMPYFFAQPSFFSLTPNPKVIGNWKELASFNDPKAWFPPGLQWVSTTPILYSTIQTMLYGLGLPLTLLSLFGMLWFFKHLKKNVMLLLPLSFLCFFFFYQSVQYAKPMRYLLPIYPVIALLIGSFLGSILEKKKELTKKKQRKDQAIRIGIVCLFVLSLLWPISFLFIYTRIHPRVLASSWIYANLPEGTKVTSEHWDDPLPLNVDGKNNERFTILELPLYNPEEKAKWVDIEKKLLGTDYIILSSNRVYGSMERGKSRFPIVNNYYDALFSGELGFTIVKEFTNRPTLPFPVPFCLAPLGSSYGERDKAVSKCVADGITIIDDYADESFTVYDHPKVLIFKKTDSQKTKKVLDTLIRMAS